MPNPQDIQIGEIGLKQCFKVLIKRKKFVLIIFILSVVNVALANLWIPVAYEVTSTVRLGSIQGLLINKEKAIEMILNKNSLLFIIKELNFKGTVEALKKDIKVYDVINTNLLKIDVVYPNIQMAFKINEALVYSFITQGKVIYQEQLFFINERLKQLDKEIENIEQDAKGKKPRMAQDSKGKKQVSSSILPAVHKNDLIELIEQRKSLKALLVNAKDFEIFDQPIEPKNPIKRKKEKVLAIGGLTLLLGIFLIFFEGYFHKNKRESIRN